jgi:hypothetical protein
MKHLNNLFVNGWPMCWLDLYVVLFAEIDDLFVGRVYLWLEVTNHLDRDGRLHVLVAPHLPVNDSRVKEVFLANVNRGVKRLRVQQMPCHLDAEGLVCSNTAATISLFLRHSFIVGS